ncbi:MAG: hypothetical protein OHK0017_03450 [Patescibacteria group bacterium]
MSTETKPKATKSTTKSSAKKTAEIEVVKTKKTVAAEATNETVKKVVKSTTKASTKVKSEEVTKGKQVAKTRPLRIRKTNTPRPSVLGYNRNWVIFDAATTPVGRLATQIARALMGKYKSDWMNDVDTGDCVVVLNSNNLVYTGRKMAQKKYYRHSLYLGGLTETTIKQQMEKDSTFVIKNAVSKMLPKNKHRADRLARLHIFTGLEHPYSDKFKN